MDLLKRFFRRRRPDRDWSDSRSNEEKTAELAGYFMAHAVWCVSDGSALIPLIAHEGNAGRQMTRFVDERLEHAVESARAWMDSVPEGCERAVLIYDGYCDTTAGRRDALSAMARDFSPSGFSIDVVLPYRSASDPSGFAVHRPKFGLRKPTDSGKLSEAFWRGVDDHKRAARVWNRYLDDSIGAT